MESIETIASLSILIMGGSFAITDVYFAISTFGLHKSRRREQKTLAYQMGLIDTYKLRHPQELALIRVEKLANILSNPTKRNNAEEIGPVLEEFIPRIAEQSNYFQTDPMRTEAFRQFSLDVRTRNWLTDPDYCISDKEFSKRTSFLGQLIYNPIIWGSMALDAILRRKSPLRKLVIYEYTSPFSC